jgi:protoporphyrin/coproporphyrin ferrochelatase
MASDRPFDGVLVVAFGGPQAPPDVRPFLENVVRGRRVPAARLDEVAGHYALFGGVSPITTITMRQARGLEDRLNAAGLRLPVFVGMRNWHPFLVDTLASMAKCGVRRAIGIVMAPHRSFSSCTQYRQNVRDARAGIAGMGMPDVQVTYVGDWHTHPKFIDANREHFVAALARLDADVRGRARVVFTAHSLPVSMPGADLYRAQVTESARLVSAAAGIADFAVVFQSRSGRPEDPWLGPDVCEYLRENARTLPAVVLHPIGFVADHVEVLYDLDCEAADVCRELGVPVVRATAVNDSPAFLDMAAELVEGVYARYRSGRPLPLVSGETR